MEQEKIDTIRERLGLLSLNRYCLFTDLSSRLTHSDLIAFRLHLVQPNKAPEHKAILLLFYRNIVH